MFRRILLALSIGMLLALSVVPASASPAVSLGSTASYNVNGNIVITQSCSANIASYQSQACNGTSPPSNAYITIIDDGHCYAQATNSSRCRWIPQDVTVQQGTWVYWTNAGNLTHGVTENTTISPGSPLGSLGPLLPGEDGAFLFNTVGTFYFYDSFYSNVPGLRGNVTVVNAISTTPMPMSVNIGLSGTIGWTVEGLSVTQANLLVSHNMAISVSPITLVTFTPLTESGSYEQSVNLSTRVESPGTVSSFIMNVLSSALPVISEILARTSSYGSSPQSSLMGSLDEPTYTQWWVNGPLKIGSPVQILQGWSSVTGSQSLDLGGVIGGRQSWVVPSKIAQTFNLNIPNVNSPLGPTSTSTASANVGFQWNFDKSTDLLLRNNDTISLLARSTTPATMYGPSGPISVSVTRDVSATISLTVQLSSTSLTLNGGQPAPSLNPVSSMSWMSVGLAGLAAAVVSGALLWQGYRSRRSLSPNAPPTGPTPYSVP